jgi:hypothetical protein
MNFKLLFFSAFLLACTPFSAQVQVGQWIDHLNYNNAKSVVKAGSIVYCSNGSGLVKYNTDDNSVEKLTKINGLSDVGVKLLRYNPYNNTVVVVYENSNIDLIKDEVITNFPDIERKTITGSKTINEIYFDKNIGYIACAFGIIKLDLTKIEVRDSYFFGNGGSFLNVNQVTSNDTCLMAATDSGVYVCRSNALLTNFANWRKVTGLASGPYNAITKYNSKILVNYSERLKSDQSLRDTLYQFDGTSWAYFSQKPFPYEIKRLYDYSRINKLFLLDQNGIVLTNPGNDNESSVTQYEQNISASINDGFYEEHLPEYRLFFTADRFMGLVKSFGNYPELNTRIDVNGPNTDLANDLEIVEGNLVVASTYLGDLWNNQYNSPYMNVYSDNKWSSFSAPISDSIPDLNCVAIDKNDKTHVAFGSWGKGVVETRKNVPYKVYNSSNSPIGIAFGSDHDNRIGGVTYDDNSNLWVVSSLNNNFLSVLRKSGTWINFDMSQFFSNNPNAAKVIVDKNNQVWIQLARGIGLMAFKPGDTFSQPNINNTKVFTTAKGNGALPSTDIYSMVEDLDGHIWVGTAKGVAIFYNPETIFTGSNWDSQQILIEQDGNVQILLEKDGITAIAIDGANRKWIGTESSGVYCLSADGLTQIHHFTAEESQLYSNAIRDIAVDGTTGDVFIATERGIQSFRTSVVNGFDGYTNVHAFPNPIRPGYGNNVYITGLVDETILKVTDVAGSVVWETKSQGGQVEWNLKTINGTKVTSGVYMIYCSTADGEQKSVTKLLVVN